MEQGGGLREGEGAAGEGGAACLRKKTDSRFFMEVEVSGWPGRRVQRRSELLRRETDSAAEIRAAAGPCPRPSLHR